MFFVIGNVGAVDVVQHFSSQKGNIFDANQLGEGGVDSVIEVLDNCFCSFRRSGLAVVEEAGLAAEVEDGVGDLGVNFEALIEIEEAVRFSDLSFVVVHEVVGDVDAKHTELIITIHNRNSAGGSIFRSGNFLFADDGGLLDVDSEAKILEGLDGAVGNAVGEFWRSGDCLVVKVAVTGCALGTVLVHDGVAYFSHWKAEEEARRGITLSHSLSSLDNLVFEVGTRERPGQKLGRSWC